MFFSLHWKNRFDKKKSSYGSNVYTKNWKNDNKNFNLAHVINVFQFMDAMNLLLLKKEKFFTPLFSGFLQYLHSRITFNREFESNYLCNMLIDSSLWQYVESIKFSCNAANRLKFILRCFRCTMTTDDAKIADASMSTVGNSLSQTQYPWEVIYSHVRLVWDWSSMANDARHQSDLKIQIFSINFFLESFHSRHE